MYEVRASDRCRSPCFVRCPMETEEKMVVKDYIVVQIDGDYAHLQEEGAVGTETKLVARALLPEEITEGCRLHYEWMTYTIQ